MAFSHVLISRPAPEAAKLAALLKETGLVPVLIPAFAFEPGYAGVDFNRAWQADMRRLAIFCSPRAVEFGLRQLPASFLDEVEIAAIGPTTANLLEKAGHTVTIIPEGTFNSESLLEHPDLKSRPGRALIFAAPGGRQALFEGLKSRDWEVDFAHVYRAIPLVPDPQLVDSLLNSDGVISVWTSGNALGHLEACLPSNVWDVICRGIFLVSSERLAEKARNLAPGQVQVTNGPGNEDIRESILRLI